MDAPRRKPARDGQAGPGGEPTRRSALRTFGAVGAGTALSPVLFRAAAHATPAAPVTLAADWAAVARVSQTTPTLQVVVNPLIQRSSPIHGNVFRELRELKADYVRFVPWYPYPRLGVAELEAPTSTTTSWDFSLIDPVVADFEKATAGHSRMLNFSTTPEWMWQLSWSISDGQLLIVGGAITGTAQAGAAWTDYTFSATVTPLQTGMAAGVSYAQAGMGFRFDEAGQNGYLAILSNFPYTSPAQPGYILFTKNTGGAAAPIGVMPLSFAVTGGQAYQMSVDVSGDTFTVSVDGSVVATATDTSYPAGTAGFWEDQPPESAMFSDVQVTGPDGSVLLSDDFTGGLSQWNPPGLTIPADPATTDFSYEQGTELAVPVQTVADYYRRVVSWYTAGGFTDELGTFRHSGHHYDLPYWEVLNELEHGLSPQLYTQLYDAIVTEIASVSPRTQFVGLALADPTQLQYFSYFLDPANHQPGVPLDWISYHFYGQPAATDTEQQYGPDTFSQADTFIATVTSIEAIRKQLAPHVRTTVNETGTILSTASTQPDPAPIPDAYWNYSGALYAYVLANLALQGIDVVGESQLVGYPGQFPSVSMVDWNTGLPNARYRVLQLLLQEMEPGWGLVPVTGADPTTCYGLGLVRNRRRKLLLVNKTDSDVPVQMSGLAGGRARVVDQTSAGGPIRTQAVTSDAFTLPGYGVAVITLPR